MNLPAFAAEDRRNWGVAGAVALAAHAGVLALVLAWARSPEPPVPEAVVLVELPPEGATPAALAEQPVAQPQPQPQPQQVLPPTPTPPVKIPPVQAPLPRDAVTLPPPLPPAPAREATSAPVPSMPAASAPAPAATGSGTGSVPGDNPRAKRAEADYFSLISAHLNRRKTYPVEAKRARQEGVVTIRFTVDRNGNVSGVSVKRGSGHALLDQATLDLLQRVAPLPRMPASMQRDSVTLSLPIEYSLRTN